MKRKKLKDCGCYGGGGGNDDDGGENDCCRTIQSLSPNPILTCSLAFPY